MIYRTSKIACTAQPLDHYYLKRIRGFQFIEVVVAVGILVIAFGSVIALSITANRGTRKSADVLFAIALAQLTMEKVHAIPYQDLTNDPTSYPVYAKSGAPVTGLYEFFEATSGQILPISKSLDEDFHKQVEGLDYHYKIGVVDLKPPQAKDCKQILITITWVNAGNTFEYKLSSLRARRTSN